MIPKRTQSDKEIIKTINNTRLNCFYQSEGGIREIYLSKFVPLEFCRFLGYYQAEGGKPEYKKGEGRQVSFVNTKVALIEDFIKLSKELIEVDLWAAEIRLKTRDFDKEYQLKKNLINLGIKEGKIKIRTENSLKDYCIRLTICSSLLYDILFNTLTEIKKDLLKSTLNEEKIKKKYLNFMQGLFAGDGNFNVYKNKFGGNHFTLKFYEEKENYAKDISVFLNKIDLNNRIIKDKNKNLFIIRANLNWNKLLLLEKLKLFDFHLYHKKSLKLAIKNHKRYKSHKHLIQLKERFNIKDVQQKIKKEKVSCYNWIKDMIDCNIIIKNKKNDWSLTEKGIITKDILNKINE